MPAAQNQTGAMRAGTKEIRDMKYVKMLGLLAVAAAALMAFAGTASATSVTSSAGSTPTIHAESEGATTLHGVVDITCQKSTVGGAVESHGSGVTVKGNIGTLTFTECGNNHVTVKNKGSLEVHGTATTGNGTLTSSGAEISIQVTSLGITCVFTTSNTHIGTYAASTSTMTIDSASIPRTGGSVFCGSSGEWTGSYKLTSPSGLEIH
jgi:hypothetical protein